MSASNPVEEQSTADQPLPISSFLDVEYRLEVLLGRTVVSVNRLVALRRGDTIPLNRLASDRPILVVGNVALASVEVIRIPGGFGARVAEVFEQEERL